MAKGNPATESIPQNEKRQNWFSFGKLCIVLAVVSCLVYANTLQNGYVLDDAMMIGENKFVQQGINGIPALLTTPHLKGYMDGLTDTYRPLSLIAFAIETQFFGVNPVVSHLFSVLTFAGAVLMLFFFLCKLFDDRRITLAFIATLLFAVHPIHTEVVANVKSRDELLCFFFAFLSLNIFINFSRTGKISLLLAGALSMFLAMLSKETAVIFVVVSPLIFFFYKNENKKRSISVSLATLTIIILFLSIRAGIITAYTTEGINTTELLDNPLLSAPNTSSRIATAVLILGRYLMLLIIPYPLICDYSYNSIPYTGFSNIWVLLSLMTYLALGIFGLYRLIKIKKDAWAFGILFYMAALSLYANIFFTIWGAQADRWLFFASAGSCLLMALVAEKWLLGTYQMSGLATRKVIPLILVCAAYGTITIARNSDWKDEYTLYTTDLKKSPNNAKLYTFVGNEMLKKYEAETDQQKKARIRNECVNYFRKALEIYPGYSSAAAGLGTSYMINDEPDSAILYFKKTIDMQPNNLIALSNLATLYMIRERYAAAVPYLSASLRLEPSDIVATFNLGICYLHITKYDSAVHSFSKVISIDPSYNSYMSFANIAAIYKQMGKQDSALKYEQITQQYIPGFKL